MVLNLDALEDLTRDFIPVKKARAIFAGTSGTARLVENGNLDAGLRD